jgi:hypothetical protein
LIATQPTGSYNTAGGITVQTHNISAGTYTFVMTDTFGDGICCENGFGSFKITVDGETIISNNGEFLDDDIIISNNGEFLESVQETFNVSSSDLDDEVEVVYDCSDLLSGCSTVRYFESRTREACMSLAISWVADTMIQVMYCLNQSSPLTLPSIFVITNLGCRRSRP